VVDVSGSVAFPDQQTMMRFVVQFVLAVEANIKDFRFGVVIFGITGGTGLTKWFNTTEWGTQVDYRNGPFGNGASTATEVALGLQQLKYGCIECNSVNASWSQLEFLYTLTYDGGYTPTWDGLDMAKDEYDLHGDPTVPGRFIVLITDGIPNTGTPQCSVVSDTVACGAVLNQTALAASLAKQGTLLLTVGMNLDNSTQALMVKWASEPKAILAVPSTDYSKLGALIPKFLSLLCPVGTGNNCLPQGAVGVDISGTGFLNTNTLFCRFLRNQEAPSADLTMRAIWKNSSFITCPLPVVVWYPQDEWTLEYTQDGRGYYLGTKFKYGAACNNARAQVHLGFGIFLPLLLVLVSKQL
jgi:hypothetical protein